MVLEGYRPLLSGFIPHEGRTVCQINAAHSLVLAFVTQPYDIIHALVTDIALDEADGLSRGRGWVRVRAARDDFYLTNLLS